MKKVNPVGSKKKLKLLSTDARRGGVRPGLGKELQKLEQIINHDFFFKPIVFTPSI